MRVPSALPWPPGDLARLNNRSESEATMVKNLKAPKGEGRWTKAQANALLRAVEHMFHRVDVEALVHGFTQDWLSASPSSPSAVDARRSGRRASG